MRPPEPVATAGPHLDLTEDTDDGATPGDVLAALAELLLDLAEQDD
jgi:hypothetical protein